MKTKITWGEDDVISLLSFSSFSDFFDETSSFVGSCSVVISSLVFEVSVVSVFLVEKKLSANESLISNEKSYKEETVIFNLSKHKVAWFNVRIK